MLCCALAPRRESIAIMSATATLRHNSSVNLPLSHSTACVGRIYYLLKPCRKRLGPQLADLGCPIVGKGFGVLQPLE